MRPGLTPIIINQLAASRDRFTNADLEVLFQAPITTAKDSSGFF
jgi:hypothetical protein